jgi:hypothetical protein
VREATAAAMADHPQLEGASEEERVSKLAAAKEGRMRKVIRRGGPPPPGAPRRTRIAHGSQPARAPGRPAGPSPADHARAAQRARGAGQ